MRPIQYVVRLMTFVDGRRMLNQTIQCVNRVDAKVVASAFNGPTPMNIDGKVVDVSRQAEVCAVVYARTTGRLSIPLDDFHSFVEDLTDISDQIEREKYEVKAVLPRVVG